MTEETKMSSEQEETQETSEKSKAEESAKEPTVPLHEHTALRSRAQEAEVEAANLKGQLSAMQSQATVATKSPMEIEIERQSAEGIAEDDMTITPALYRQQQAFEKQQAEQTAVSSALATKSTAQMTSTNLAKVEHDDWQQVVSAAVPHMTKGEVLDIEAEIQNFGEVAYAKAQEVLKRVKPAPETSESEAAKAEAADKAAAEKAAEVAADTAKTPTQEEILATVDPVTAAAAKL